MDCLQASKEGRYISTSCPICLEDFAAVPGVSACPDGMHAAAGAAAYPNLGSTAAPVEDSTACASCEEGTSSSSTADACTACMVSPVATRSNNHPKDREGGEVLGIKEVVVEQGDDDGKHEGSMHDGIMEPLLKLQTTPRRYPMDAAEWPTVGSPDEPPTATHTHAGMPS